MVPKFRDRPIVIIEQERTARKAFNSINEIINNTANYWHATRNFTNYSHATRNFTNYSHATRLLEAI